MKSIALGRNFKSSELERDYEEKNFRTLPENVKS
jgi:hypothetical protein